MAATGKTARIERALHYRLSQLVLSPTRRVASPGVAFTPIVGEIYLAAAAVWNATDRAEVGSIAPRRHIGFFQVNVRGPEIGNPETQTEVADAIIEHFDKQVISNASVVVRIGSFNGGRAVPYRSGALVEDGWRLIPVNIPFWCDIFPT